VTEKKDEHSAKPHAPGPHVDPARGPIRPPRPAIGLPLSADGRSAGNPCEGCDHCCRYVTIEIATPRSKLDFDNIRWYVLHQSVSVLCTWEGDWMVQFDTPCAWLKDGRCSHYALRPEICRDYDPAECERYCTVPAEKILIRDEKDLERYLEERKARAAKRRKSRPKAGRRAEARTAKAAG
jgi:uncharacterized protein